MERSLIKEFWSCGDNEIIEFAIHKARLNKNEKEVLLCILDDCLSQEETAEKLYLSTRKVQNIWYNATEKLLAIPWVRIYAKELREARRGEKHEKC